MDICTTRCSHAQTQTPSIMLFHTHTPSHKHTHKHTHVDTNALTHIHTSTQCRAHTHTYTLTCTKLHTKVHTHRAYALIRQLQEKSLAFNEFFPPRQTTSPPPPPTGGKMRSSKSSCEYVQGNAGERRGERVKEWLFLSRSVWQGIRRGGQWGVG